MKIVFMGTPEFAAVSLRHLIEEGHQVVLVVTQPDKQKNRGRKVVYSPVKEVALENKIPVIQSVKLQSDHAALEALRKAHDEAEIGVVVAFGQILPEEVLEMPRLGYINVHGSLLPKLRGASPIQTAILLGEEPTGVTVMKVEKGLDCGDMLSKSEISVGGRTAGELEHEMADVGARLLTETLEKFYDITPQPQNEDEATYCSTISKEDGHIDFRKSAESIERMTRAYNPWPGTYAKIKNNLYKFWKIESIRDTRISNVGNLSENFLPGEIVFVGKDMFTVACGEKGNERLNVLEIQAPGKKRMKTGDFLRGNRLEVGELFR